jgi:multiple sugar transport system permease protein
MQRAEGKFGVVTFMALGYGLVWGGLWMILSSMLLMLVSGLVLSPPVGMAAAAGAISGIVLVFTDAKTRSRQVAFTVAGVGVLSMLILTMAQPFGVPVENGFLIQLVTLLVWTGLTTASLFLCFDGYVAGTAKRYLVEVLIIRLMKGLALVLFTVFVALPFYVMVMTSLKSQQKLLANPLDFSIDLGQGFAPLFRSYIELFTQFHFGTFLMNSAIVSVITVMLTLAFAVPGAYAVARLRFPGQAFLSRSILLIYMVPAIVLVVPLYAVFSQLGLRNSLFGLLVVYPATTIPGGALYAAGLFPWPALGA